MTDEIAGYKVNFRKQLGRGAIGNVYMARDNDGSKIAAKQVDNLRSERAAVRELENARRHVRLNHENIVKIFHILNEEEIWVFMELCEGGNLNNYSKEHFSDLQENKINIMHQMSKGLAFLHSCRIAHRDMKPENILIKPQTESLPIIVKLTDFGLAKYLDPEDSTSAMETKLGTRPYMAPEFYEKGEIKYHKDVDIFAMGLTFAAIITTKKGQHLKPIAAGWRDTEWAQPIGLAMLVRRNDGQPPLIVLEDNPEDNAEIDIVKEIIRNAIAFRPEDRPSAENIVKRLGKLLTVTNETNLAHQEEAMEVSEYNAI